MLKRLLNTSIILLLLLNGLLLLGYFLRPAIAQSALDFVAEKKPEVLAELLQSTGLQWQFEISSVNWQRANPVVELDHLKACIPETSDAKNTGVEENNLNQTLGKRCSLVIDNLRVAFDAVASLIHRKPLFYAVDADAVELVLSRSMQGVNLAGLRTAQSQQSLELQAWISTLRQLQLKRGIVGFVAGDLDWQTKQNWPAHQIQYSCERLSGVLKISPVSRNAETLDVNLIGDTWKMRECLSRDWRGFVKADYSARTVVAQSDGAKSNRIVSYTDFTATVEPHGGKSHLFARLSTSPEMEPTDNSEGSTELLAPFWTPLLLEGELSFAAIASYFSDDTEIGQWLSMKWHPLDITGATGSVPIGEGFLSLGVEDERGPEISILQGRVDLPTLIRQIDILYRPDEKLRTVMRKLNPRGSAEYLRLRLPIEKPADFQLEASFRDVSVDGVNPKAISAENVSGLLSVQRLGGVLKLDRSEEYSSIKFPTTYDDKILFSPNEASVSWFFSNDRVYIAGQQLDLDYIPLKTILPTSDSVRETVPLVGSFFVNSRLRADAAPSSMDLEVGIPKGSIAKMLRFVPDNASPATRRWIAQSKAEGQAQDIGFIYRGTLKSKPRVKRIFMLSAELSGTSLSFASDWPQLRGTSGSLYIDSELTSAEIKKTSLAEIEASEVFATIDFSQAKSNLSLTGNFRSTLDGLKRSLLQSPVNSAIPEAIKGWDMRGKMHGKLDLALPLSGIADSASSSNNAGQQQGSLWEAMKLGLQSEIDAATIALPEQNIVVSAIKGPLAFGSRTGFSSDGLQANLWGRPINIELQHPELSSDKGNQNFASQAWKGDILLKANGLVEAGSVKQWLEIPASLPIDGTAYTNFRYSYAKGNAQLAINSNLKGVDVHLPEPFIKTSADKLQFNLLFDEQDGFESRSASIDRWVSLSSNRFRDAMDARYQVTLFPSGGGRKDKPLSDNLAMPASTAERLHTLTFEGELPIVDLGQWISLYERIYPSEGESALNRDAYNSDTGGFDLRNLLFEGVDIDSLLIAGNEVRDVAVGADFGDKEVNLRVFQEQIQGQMVIPFSLLPKLQGCDDDDTEQQVISEPGELGRPGVLMPSLPSLDAFSERVTLDMRLVDIALFSASVAHNTNAGVDRPNSPEERSVFNNRFFQPGCLPPASVRIAELRTEERQLGAWSFLHTASESVALLHDITGEYAGLNFRTPTDDGLIWASESGGKISSSLTADVTTSEIERAIQTFGDVPTSPLFADSTNVSVSLHWQDAPHLLTLNALNGEAAFDLQKGRFVEVPSVASGFLKLVSAVNLQRYISRLQVDLSDLYEEGLGFDELSGAIEFDHGILRFDEKPVAMKASSSNFTLSGSADLTKNTIDGQLVTTLPVASNLPWIAALAGGLPVAAGTFIATQALDSELKRLSSVVYKVEGNLQEPEIGLMTIFNDGNSETPAHSTKRKRRKHHHRRR